MTPTESPEITVAFLNCTANSYSGLSLKISPPTFIFFFATSETVITPRTPYQTLSVLENYFFLERKLSVWEDPYWRPSVQKPLPINSGGNRQGSFQKLRLLRAAPAGNASVSLTFHSATGQAWGGCLLLSAVRSGWAWSMLCFLWIQ